MVEAASIAPEQLPGKISFQDIYPGDITPAFAAELTQAKEKRESGTPLKPGEELTEAFRASNPVAMQELEEVYRLRDRWMVRWEEAFTETHGEEVQRLQAMRVTSEITTEDYQNSLTALRADFNFMATLSRDASPQVIEDYSRVVELLDKMNDHAFFLAETYTTPGDERYLNYKSLIAPIYQEMTAQLSFVPRDIGRMDETVLQRLSEATEFPNFIANQRRDVGYRLSPAEEMEHQSYKDEAHKAGEAGKNNIFLTFEVNGQLTSIKGLRDKQRSTNPEEREEATASLTSILQSTIPETVRTENKLPEDALKAAEGAGDNVPSFAEEQAYWLVRFTRAQIADAQGRVPDESSEKLRHWKLVTAQGMSPETAEAIRDAFSKETVPAIHAFYQQKAQAMGKEYLTMAELQAPLGDPEKYSWKECVTMGIAAAARISEDAAEKTAFFLEQRFDAEPRAGKSTNPFGTSLGRGVMPVAHISFGGTPNDMCGTLHETGHQHQYGASAHHLMIEYVQPPGLAEVSAETMVFLMQEQMLHHAQRDPETYRALANQLVGEQVFYMALQIGFYNFERELYRTLEDPEAAGKFRTPKEAGEMIQQIWKKEMGDILGPNVAMEDALGNMFSLRMHHFSEPFYSITYAFSRLVAQGIVAELGENQQQTAAGIVALWASGYSKSISDTLKAAGVDIEDPGFWQKAARTMADNFRGGSGLARTPSVQEMGPEVEAVAANDNTPAWKKVVKAAKEALEDWLTSNRSV